MRFSLTLLTLLSIYLCSAQCSTWESIYSDSYEYTTPIPGIIPGSVYQNTSQTYAGGIHSGSRHMYLNFVNGFTGPALDTSYNVCVGSDIQLSFWFKDTWGGDNDFTINLYDENDILLNTQSFAIAGNNSWNQYLSPELTMTTGTLRFELVNNGTTGGNDLAVDDFELNVCSNIQQLDYLICSSSSVINLYDLFTGMPAGGTWSGPSALSGADLGTFDPNINVGGLYTYEFASQSPCPTPYGSIQVGNVSNINLGNDTVLCAGETLIVDAGLGYDFYNWSDGSNGQSTVVSQNDTAIVIVGATGSNLVINGDFEQGDVNFTSDYAVGSGGAWGPISDPGEYLVTTSPSLAHNNFPACGDHTSGTGNMFVANGSDVANTNVWCQTINVDQNTDYLFSTWVTNAENSANVPELQFFIDNNQLGEVFTPTQANCSWQEFNEVWNSGLNTNIEICIVNQNTTGGGNDFVLDDISFRPVCTITDTIIVSYDTISVDAGVDASYCENDKDTVMAVSNYSGASFSWNNGVNASWFIPDTTGSYIVTATSPNNCTANDTVEIEVIQMDWDFDTIISGPTSCGENDGFVSLMLEGAVNDPSYTWTGPGAGNPNFINASVWGDLSPGWYYCSVTIDGCSRNDSIQVTVEDPPMAILSGSPLVGPPSLSVNFSNDSQNADDYYWDFGNGNTLNVGDLSGQTQVYEDLGDYTVMLVANAGGCSDTAYLTVTVIEPENPLVYNIPNVFTPNGDGFNDVFKIDIQNTVNFQIDIRNRWGNLIFTSTDPLFEWNGKIGPAEAAEGTYFYSIIAEDEVGEKFNLQGFIQLKRN